MLFFILALLAVPKLCCLKYYLMKHAVLRYYILSMTLCLKYFMNI